MASIVFHRSHLGRGAQRVRDAFGGSFVVGRKGHAYMAVVEDGVVLPVGLFDLVQRLGDQKALEAVSGHERQRRLEEIEPAERGKFVQHQHQPMAASFCMQILVRRRPIWFRISRTSGLVRLMSDGGTTK